MAYTRKVTLLALAPLVIAPGALVALGSLSMSGCEAYHNEAERLEYKSALDAEEAKLYPDQDKNKLKWPGYDPPDPTKCPNNRPCLPDPGSRVVTKEECDAYDLDYEFMAIPIWDFEDDRPNFDDLNRNRQREREGITKNSKLWEPTNTDERYMLHGYTYRDDTTLNYYPFGWEPPAISDPTYKETPDGKRVAAPRCGIEDNHIFHIAGGPFLEWGGGFGRALRCLNTDVWDDTNPGQKAIDDWRTLNDIPPPGTNPEVDKIYCHTGQKTGSTKNQPPACRIPEADERGAICPKRDRLYRDKDATEAVPAEELALIGQAIDVSEWEGISFWARRGPNSQPGIRLLVGDKRTDDDISFLQYVIDPETPRYCERTIECACKSATRPCTKVTAKEAWRINTWVTSAREDDVKLTPEPVDDDPKTDANEGTVTYVENPYHLKPILPGDSICWNRKDTEGTPDEPEQIAARTLQYCGDSVTRHQTDSGKSLNMGFDPFIHDTKCQEYSFRGSITSMFAFNPDSEIPAQQKPAENSQQCGDHWMRSVQLGLDWQFYTVPFKELYQQGWSKRSYELDLTALTLVRFTWDRGYIDYYIDDVRFYRTKKTAAKK